MKTRAAVSLRAERIGVAVLGIALENPRAQDGDLLMPPEAASLNGFI